MNKLFEGIRPTDVVLAAVMSGLGVYLMLENINHTRRTTSASTRRAGC